MKLHCIFCFSSFSRITLLVTPQCGEGEMKKRTNQNLVLIDILKTDPHRNVKKM